MEIGDQHKLLFQLYNLIWEKSPYLKNSTINIPDTIIIDDEPLEWYFTNKNGEIKKKLRENLKVKNIVKTFCRKTRGSEVIAKFITLKRFLNNNSDVREILDPLERKYRKITGQNVNKIERKGNSSIVVEYFNKKQLLKFLRGLPQPKQVVGILQIFITPQTINNQTIRVIWTQRVCSFERRTNFKSFLDTNYEGFERLTTFDGPSYYSKLVTVKPTKVTKQIRDTLGQIVRHIQALKNGKLIIKQMICYFKLDRRNRPYLLFCSAVKSDSIDALTGTLKKSSMNISDRFELPSTYRIKFNALKPHNFQNGFKNICLKCQKNIIGIEMVQLKYSYIVKRYEEGRIHQKQNKPNKKISYKSKVTNNVYEKSGYVREINQCIPFILKKIYPMMSYEEYKENIQHYDFMDKTILVCQECYIKFMRFFGKEGGSQKIQENSKLHKGRMYKLKKEQLIGESLSSDSINDNELWIE